MSHLKILAGVAGIGATSTAGYFITTNYIFSSKKSVGDLFKNEEFLVLLSQDSSEDNEKGKAAWEEYRKSQKGTSNSYPEKDTGGISNGKEKKDQDNAFKEFKDECIKRASLKVSNPEDSEYQNVKKGCSRPKKLSEIVQQKEGYSLLSKDSSSADKWNGAGEEYRKANIKTPASQGVQVAYKDSDTGSVEGGQNAKTASTAIDKYKDKCVEKSGTYVDVNAGGNDETLKGVLNWCSYKE